MLAYLLVAIVVQIVNFGSEPVDLQISIDAKELNILSSGSTSTILTSSDVKDENSLTNPTKVVPVTTPVQNACKEMNIILSPCSLYSLDLLTIMKSVINLPGLDIFNISSN
ncbi:hypothetical protein LIER_43264 [Lithospermum erythrorhizon]|uniref:Uncharacterized protein n=1 Tax=Lithospermum erythrorhizon TaxID=34254 RepID=A0AAV3PSP6_LITER